MPDKEIANDYILPCEKKLRSNRFADVLKIGVLKHFAKFTGKKICWSFFFIKLEVMPSNFIRKKL